MGFISKLLRGPQPPTQETSYTVTSTVLREEMVEVVGESNYQPAIRAACGAKGGEEVRFDCMAELVPEPTNRYDRNAVRVDIDGRCVGYLSKVDARELGPAIAEGIAAQGTGMCRAVIAGREGGETTNLGVFLHLRVHRS